MTAISPPNITVFDIADWFLARAKAEEKPLKPMKLQKLVYFAYGWYYAYHNKALFPETIYAFRHGPVVQELFERFRNLKGSPITDDVEPKNIDSTIASLLGSVWKVYEPYTDLQLSDMTHAHAPWINAYRSGECFAIMSPESNPFQV